MTASPVRVLVMDDDPMRAGLRVVLPPPAAPGPA